MSLATRNSWKVMRMPEAREALDFHALYSHQDAERIRRGFVPEVMEHKWFIFFEQGWLYFHRSWTGICVFALRFDDSHFGIRVVESWVNRDPLEYGGSDVVEERKLVESLIRGIFLEGNIS